MWKEPLKAGQPALTARQKSAEGIVGGASTEGPNDGRRGTMTERNGNASELRQPPAAAVPLDEPVAGSSCQPESIPPDALLAKVLERTNLQRALKQVRQNHGAPGIDGMTVEEGVNSRNGKNRTLS